MSAHDIKTIMVNTRDRRLHFAWRVLTNAEPVITETRKGMSTVAIPAESGAPVRRVVEAVTGLDDMMHAATLVVYTDRQPVFYPHQDKGGGVVAFHRGAKTWFRNLRTGRVRRLEGNRLIDDRMV